MLKNYFKTSFRSLMKNPLSSFINLFGLSIAIGISLMVYAFMEFEYRIDGFHEHKHQVYLTTFFSDRDGSPQQYGTSPAPLADMMEADFTHIQKTCRIEDRPVVVKFEDHVFHEQVRFVDPEFLEMFTFPLQWGAPGTLHDQGNVVISHEMSLKYFGEGNPLGKSLFIKSAEGIDKYFTISGVAQPFPRTRVIEFDFLINFENVQATHPSYDPHDWTAFINATFIQVDNVEDLGRIEMGMSKYQTLQNEALSDWDITGFGFEPLATLYEHSVSIRDDISPNSSAPGRLALPIIAIFMLALACFNYINIAIVSAAKRLKEIGVRKVIGASRGGVVFQFLAENIFITAFALLLGYVLAATIIVPWFINISSRSLELDLLDPSLWIFLGVVLLLTGITSGLYPAFYIARFQVIRIFKGTIQFGRKNLLTKTFLGVQLILACILITGAITYTQNSAYQATRGWGYDQMGALFANIPDRSAFERLNAAVLQDPNVLSVAGSSHHLGDEITTTVIQTPDRQYEANELDVDANYFETMGLKLRQGRFFRDREQGEQQVIVVNELLVGALGLEQPIGHRLEIDSAKYEIVGVVQDFHIYNFYYELLPTIFKVAPPQDFRYLSMKVRPGTEGTSYENLKAQWALLFPETPFQGGHQVDLWQGFFADLDTQVRFTSAIAFIAVLLASLGLYGLVTLNVSGRIREFSIRKVLGAGLRNIASSITKQYVVLSMVALLVGAPLSHWLIKAQIETLFAYPKPTNLTGVLLAVFMLIAVLLAVIFTQVSRVSKSNPVDGLKVE